MTVAELKDILNTCNDDNIVSICVDTPSGFVCPDGCTIGVRAVRRRGVDFHGHETLIVPEFKLEIKDIDGWKKGN